LPALNKCEPLERPRSAGYITISKGYIIKMNTTNSEKQARFRKEEVLKRGTEGIFGEWQTNLYGSHIPPEEVRELLERASDLPAGWTDEDYQRSINKLEQLRLDLLTNAHDLSNDVNVAHSAPPKSGQSRFKPGMVEMARSDVEAGHELARHLISSIKLSKCSEIATTAAVMEAVRHVARELIVSPEIPRSRATTACLAALPQHHGRPEWFVDEMVNMLRDRLGNALCSQLGPKLASGKREWINGTDLA
jgi:hypothetical protein